MLLKPALGTEGESQQACACDKGSGGDDGHPTGKVEGDCALSPFDLLKKVWK
jgi:hypothetical protein